MPDLITIPTIEDVTRRTFITGALASAFLLACGDEDEGPQAAPTPAMRTITDRYGSVEVPVTPSRVVALERVTLFHCLALGIQPLATALTAGRTLEGVHPDWLKTRPSKDIKVFDDVNLDVEGIAGLSPDLMVSYQEPKTIESLRQIAPVAIPNYNGSPDWRNLVAGIGSILNKDSEVAAFQKSYEEGVARFRRESLPRLAGKTASVVRLTADAVRIEVLNSFPGQVLADAGVERPANQQTQTANGFMAVSLERLNEADADYLFIVVVDDASDSANLDRVRALPIWRTLKAVQNDQVHVVKNPTWFGGLHYLAAELMLTELAAIVAG
jgi:iron complex transport system substrate-binding protein